MAGNPSMKKREKERRRQEKQKHKAAKREQRKQDRANGVVPVDSDTVEPGEPVEKPTPPEPEQV
jgi:hypothetical protein